MVNTRTFVRTALSSVAIVGGTLFAISNSDAANYNKQQCTVVEGNVKALAIPDEDFVSCVCPSDSSSLRDERRRRSGAASTQDCFIQTPQQVTNFNQPTLTGKPKPDPRPRPEPPDVAKANNGWGNGGDPTNPGSFQGQGVSNHKGLGAQAQANSKQNNSPASESGGQHEGR